MKKIIFSLILIIFSVISVYALSNNFTINHNEFSFLENETNKSFFNEFNDDYELTNSIEFSESDVEKEIEELTKKIVFLLLGRFNNTNESSEEYYKRYNEYLDLRYAPEIPKDENSYTGYDENSQEYKDDTFSRISVPGIFKVFDELKVNYSSFGNIQVLIEDDVIISSIILPNVLIKEEDKSNPLEYVNVQTNITIYCFFKELNGEYKLYHLFGEIYDNLDDYFTQVENDEKSKSMQISTSYDSQLKDIYDFSKVYALTTNQLDGIYNSNSNNIVVLNSYYNNYLVASANGFFINDGLVVTTWKYIEKSLGEAQFMAIRDNNGNSYKIDGIVTVNMDTDVAVLKLKDKVNNKVVLGDYKQLNKEDPVISISSKTGVGLSLQSGIVVSTDGYINTSIPMVKSDEGSPLFNSLGQVVGMNTSNQVNTSISLAINSDILKEIQNKFNNVSFEDIKCVSFDKLKENYYVKYNDEKVKKDIPTLKWNKYSKIGDIENTISLELVKANYKDGVVSLRYHNVFSDYLDTMSFANAFKEQLIKDGFKEKLKSSKKCIYENNKYQVVIISEFDYLIVVMNKL